jgi:predicted nucleotidyltransferase
MRKPKDKDFIETIEGLLFCIVGYLHPPERYTAYLKYRPATQGPWKRYGTFYQRMLQVYSAAETATSNDWLRNNFPEYIKRDEFRGIEFPLIPQNKVIRYYIPEIRLVEILGGPQDFLETKVVKLVEMIAETSGVSPSNFGITGSILLKIHSQKISDIDLLIYGRENTDRIAKAVRLLQEETRLETYQTEEIKQWRLRQQKTLGIPKKHYSSLVWPHWKRGRIDGTNFSIHPTRFDDEITLEYGTERYSAIEPIECTASISDSQESMFVPARYSIEDLKFRKKPSSIKEINSVVSFEGVFSSIVQKGDRVQIKGTLEKVENIQTGEVHYQIVIGTLSGQGWILPLIT